MQQQQIAVSQYSTIQGKNSAHYKSIIACISFTKLVSPIFKFRASPSEFVIPLAKYIKAVYHTRVSVGMRFRMLFETEESSVRR